MAFFTVKADAESVKDYEGGSGQYINKSGMYDVVIKHIIADQTANGSKFLNLWILYNGKEQPLFQAIRLTNNDGSPNFGQDLFTKLCIIAGATDGTDIADPVPMQLPMGKGGAMVECMVLPDFTDIPVHMHVRMQYSMYNDKIQESKVIYNFFRYEDKATASEIVNDVKEKGKQYEKEAENIKPSYKDGLTEEDVEAWLAERRGNAKKDGGSTNNKPANGFGSKRSFGKK